MKYDQGLVMACSGEVGSVQMKRARTELCSPLPCWIANQTWCKVATSVVHFSADYRAALGKTSLSGNCDDDGGATHSGITVGMDGCKFLGEKELKSGSQQTWWDCRMTCNHNTLLILSLTAQVGVLLQNQHKIWGENKIKSNSFPGCHSLGGKVKASHPKDFYQNLRRLLGERRIMKLTIQSSCLSLTFNIMTLFIMSYMDKSPIKTSISWMGFVVSSFSRYVCWYFSSITDTQIFYLDVAFVPLHAPTKTPSSSEGHPVGAVRCVLSAGFTEV